MKKSGYEWAKHFDIEIIDPDGWRFRQGEYGPRSLDDEISLQEFNSRLIVSTISPLINYLDVDREIRNQE